jgi:DNA polymerase-3 subunit gamma/tau
MFEQLSAFQPALAEQMSRQIQENSFAQVNLFGGERYSLRMSFALECARVLSCRKEGRQDCDCESCRRFSTLSVPNLLIISQRDHESVIETSLTTFARLYNDFSKNLVIRTVRILLLQYHPALKAVNQSQNAVFDAASVLNELLIDFSNLAQFDAKTAKRWADDIRSSLKILYAAARKNTTITINQVRDVDQWINQTSMGESKRFIILEAMEETNISARNSLLKMLEEPPSDVYFFLISSFPNRIMQTILSRVRRYAFPPLHKDSVACFLQPFYLHERSYEDLQHFFLQEGGMDVQKIGDLAKLFALSVRDGRYLEGPQLSEMLSEIERSDSMEYVLKAVLEQFGIYLAEQTLPSEKAARLSALVNDAYQSSRLYNQNGRLMLEALYYRMMEDA